MKKVCFCVIIGQYDILKNPLYVTEDWEYVCITDQDITSDFWKIIKINCEFDSKWYSRYIWTHYYDFIDADIILKHDACMIIKNDLNEIYNLLGDADILLSKHDRRNCIYQEGIAVNNKFPNYTNIVNKQIEQYKLENFPINYGLHYQGVRLFKNNDKIKHFNMLWWNEIISNSWRDQLSFDYIRWKLENTENQININYLNYTDLIKKYFIFKRHL